MNIAIQAHNQKPASVWSSGGENYNNISRTISDSIGHCVQRLAPQRGETILDLATGTGWTSRVVARSGAIVIGCDIAPDLLAAAKELATKENLVIKYLIGDAESLPFDANSFDAVISTCGIMFASKQEAAAGELARVCRKGGRIALTTWLPDSNVFEIFKLMKPYMPPPPDPPPQSPFAWGKTERITELLGSHFDLKFEKGISYHYEPNAEAGWNTFLHGYGPTKTLAANLDDEKRAALRRDFMALLDRFPTPLGIAMPREYWVTLGVRK